MSADELLDKDWTKNPPAEGEEAQWLKEQIQNNRRARFRLRRRKG